MAIETLCQGCGQRLRVADEHAGKKARCPNCQAINPIPASGTPASDPYAPAPLPSSCNPAPTLTPVASLTPLPTPQQPADTYNLASEERWTLKIDDGRTFGPVSRGEMDKWFSEGRVTPGSQLMSDRDNRWRPAGEIYPSLGVPGQFSAQPSPFGASASPNPAANPFADREQTYSSPYNAPYGSYGTSTPRTWSQPHNGVLVLVFGILSLVVCAIFGPVAVIMGHSSLNEIKRGRMDPEGHGLVLGGTILGWIGTVILLGFCGCIGLGGILDAANF